MGGMERPNQHHAATGVKQSGGGSETVEVRRPLGHSIGAQVSLNDTDK